VPFVVTTAHVIEHERTIAQVVRCQLLFRARLARQQPVHGLVEIVLGGIGDVQFFGQVDVCQSRVVASLEHGNTRQ